MKRNLRLLLFTLFFSCHIVAAVSLDCKSLLARTLELFPNSNLPLEYRDMDAALAEQAMGLIRESYRKAGGSKYQDSVELSKDLTHSYIARNDAGDLIVFLGARRTEFGNKITVVATDETMTAKVRSAFWFNHLILNEHGYAELSGASLLGITRLLNEVPIVGFERAENILASYAIRRPTKEELENGIKKKQIPNTKHYIRNAYVREIPVNGVYEVFIKVMVGRPK